MFTQIRAPMAAARRSAPLAVSVCRKQRRVVSRCNHAVRLELSKGSATAIGLAVSPSRGIPKMHPSGATRCADYPCG